MSSNLDHYTSLYSAISLSRPFGEGSSLLGTFTIIYLLIIIFPIFLFIFLSRRQRQSLTDPSFITPIILEMVEAVKKTDDTNKYNALLQEKIKEIADIDTLRQNLEQNLEKEKQTIIQKVLEGTSDLHVEHARLHSAINNFSLGFIMTDNKKNIIFVNNAAKNLFSFQQSDTILKLQDLQLHVTGKINFLQCTEDVLKNGEALIFEDIRVDNKYTNIFISPIIASGSNMPDTTGVAILIEDKTEEILIKRSRENFFIIASHELRTPLTGIKGYIAIIKQLYFENIKDEQLKRIINDIDISSTRLVNIVNDFLETSKLEPDKIVIRKDPCDLITIINSSIKETSSIAVEKKLYINFSNPEANAAVLGDKDKIKQILINLISNALKYTEQGGITISLDRVTQLDAVQGPEDEVRGRLLDRGGRIEERSKTYNGSTLSSTADPDAAMRQVRNSGLENTPDAKYKISITDTGKGMSKEMINLLFSKFQQTDPNKPRNIISTGLGLYISKLLAEKMQGTIKLENTEEGKGSTFSLSLPAYQLDIAIPNTTGVN